MARRRTPASAREDGRSAIAAAARAIAAMQLGRLDDETTANVGTIDGGAGINVVPERCRVEAEVRSLDEAKVEALVSELVDHLTDGANAAECDLDVTVERLFRRLPARARARPRCRSAEAALRACGFEPRHIVDRRRLGRERPERSRLPVREPRERHRAQPPARRARQRRRAGAACSTSRSRCSTDGWRRAEAARAGSVIAAEAPEPWQRARGRGRRRSAGPRAPTRRWSARARPATRSSSTSRRATSSSARGGFDIVHVNLTRGLDGRGMPGAHVMKLNYTLAPARGAAGRGRASCAIPLGRPVGVFALHGQLAPVAWALAQARAGLRVGYVQTAGGALPGALSDTVRQLRDRGLLAGHMTAGPAYGGGQEAITTAGALHDGLAEERLGRRARRARPGDPRLRLGARPRRDRRARLRARGARARLPDGARRAHVLRRPARAPSRPLPPHAHRAASCCSRR